MPFPGQPPAAPPGGSVRRDAPPHRASSGGQAEADARPVLARREPDAAAVRLDDGPRDGQPEAGAVGAPRGLAAAAVEGLEDALEVGLADPVAGVGDLDLDRVGA